MIGNRVKIQRLCQLYFKATGVLDRLALGVAIGIGRRGGCTKSRGVKGERCMHVQVAKVGIAIRVAVSGRL